jgi:hypothetical protein
MSQVLSSVISDHTVTFFAQSRMFTIQSDHINYKTIRDQLIADPYAEAGPLIELADVKVALQNADPAGLLKFVGDALCYKDKELSLGGVWVQKILGYRAESLDFEPIFKGLDSLMRNPSMRARERFPIFAEISGFGFLKDGRMGAFKAVRANFTDIHSGQFDNSPGKTLSMPREEVDDDAEKTCSAGFHLGALAYVQEFGHISTSSTNGNKVVFCAFWPEHVVAIPVDYDGKKMRVWQYEVLEEVAPESVQEFLRQREFVVPNAKQDGTAYGNGYAKGFQDGEDGRDAKEYPDNTDEQRGYNDGYHDGVNAMTFDDSDPEAEDDRSPYDIGFAHGVDECNEGAECDPNPEDEAPELDSSDYEEYRRGYRAGYVSAESTS